MRAGARYHKPRRPSRPIQQPSAPPLSDRFRGFRPAGQGPDGPKNLWAVLGGHPPRFGAFAPISGGLPPAPPRTPWQRSAARATRLPGRAGRVGVRPIPVVPSQGPRAAPMRGFCLPNRFAMKPRTLRELFGNIQIGQASLFHLLPRDTLDRASIKLQHPALDPASTPSSASMPRLSRNRPASPAGSSSSRPKA